MLQKSKNSPPKKKNHFTNYIGIVMHYVRLFTRDLQPKHMQLFFAELTTFIHFDICGSIIQGYICT
jgi:hypothetical protein